VWNLHDVHLKHIPVNWLKIAKSYKDLNPPFHRPRINTTNSHHSRLNPVPRNLITKTKNSPPMTYSPQKKKFFENYKQIQAIAKEPCQRIRLLHQSSRLKQKRIPKSKTKSSRQKPTNQSHQRKRNLHRHRKTLRKDPNPRRDNLRLETKIHLIFASLVQLCQ